MVDRRIMQCLVAGIAGKFPSLFDCCNPVAKKLLSVALAFSLVCSSALPVLSASTAKAESADWMSLSSPTVESVELPDNYTVPSIWHFNTDCDARNITVITRPAKAGQSEGTATLQCAVSTPRGLTDGRTLVAGSPAGTISDYYYHEGVLPIPHSNKLVHIHGDLYSGFDVRLYKALVPQYNNNTGEVSYLPSPVLPFKSSNTLRDSSGAAYRLRNPGAIAYSSNGKWMVAEGTGAYLRINLETDEVLPFTYPSVTFPYSSLDPFVSLAISPDGRYAAMNRASSVKIFDFNTCTDIPVNAAAPSARRFANCQYKELSGLLPNGLTNYSGAYYMRFANNNLLTFVTDYRDSSGKFHKISNRMVPTGMNIPKVSYVALGDSFSSGEGEYLYESGTDVNENKCHLSPYSYPYLVSHALGIKDFHSVACSGARIDDVMSTVQYKYPQEGGYTSRQWFAGISPQNDYISAAHPNTVTLSMGGNDIGFKNKLQNCVTYIGSCYGFKGDRKEIADEINRQFSKLVSMYNSIKEQGGVEKVYVLGYPNIFGLGDKCDKNVFLEPNERKFSRALVEYLNATIKAAAEQAGVQYVDVEHAFTGYELCDPGEKAVNGLSGGNDVLSFLGSNGIGNESFHPNSLGHELLASALMAQTNNLSKPMPGPTPNKRALGTDSQAYQDLMDGVPTGDDNLPGRPVYVEQHNYFFTTRGSGKIPFNTGNLSIGEALQPSGIYRVVFASTPIEAGTYVADEQGNLNIEIPVPGELEPGLHTLHILGKSLSGEDLDIYQPIYIAASQDDIDGDGTPNNQEKCLAVEPANVDYDKDDIDDACDGAITEPSQTATTNRQTPTSSTHPAQATLSATSTNNKLPTLSTQMETTVSPLLLTQDKAAALNKEGSNSKQAKDETGGRATKNRPNIFWALSLVIALLVIVGATIFIKLKRLSSSK